MKLLLICEGRERAQAIRDEIKAGKLSFRGIARKYGVSIPYVSALARRLQMGRTGRLPSHHSLGLSGTPIMKPISSLGIR